MATPAPVPQPTNFAALAQGAPAQAPAFSLQSLLGAPDPNAASPFANESFLKSQEASRSHIVQQVQNAANEIGRQNQFQLEQLGGLPSRFEGIYGAANQGFQQNANALANAQAGSLGSVRAQGSADAQMAPILAALAQQQAGNLSNVPLLEAGIRELGTRQQGQLAQQGNEMLMQHDKETSQYVGQREGEERQHGWQMESEQRGRDFEKEQAANAQSHAEKMAEIDHQYRMGELSAQQAFQAKEAEKQRAAEAARAAADRKAAADAAAAARQQERETYRDKVLTDKEFGIGDFAVPKPSQAVQQTIDSILRSYSPEDASVTKGAAMMANPDRRQYNDVVGDKDYQNAVASIGKEKGRSLMGDGSSYWSLLPGVSGSKITAEDAAQALIKLGKPGHAAILLASLGKDAGSARDAILSQLNPGG